MKPKQVFEHIQQIINALDGVGDLGRRVLCAAVPAAAFATSGCVAVYGTPFADYVLDGTVVSAETGDPIAGIEVEFSDREHSTAVTNSVGRWAISINNDLVCNTDCTIIVQDVDGDENGAFQDLQSVISLSHTDEGDGDWDNGRWEAHNLLFELEPLDM
jgi:putative lipoprotein (rSAM/lipoprotein system)